MPKHETEMSQNGLAPLSAVSLRTLIGGKSFFGLYRAPFQYVIRIGTDGSLAGQNNAGTKDTGSWNINKDDGTFSVTWQNYWDANVTRAYAQAAAIHMFNAQSGDWLTSLIKEISHAEFSRYAGDAG